jgi:hypothetical protein
MDQRLLHAITKVYYGSYVRLCLGSSTLAMLKFLGVVTVPFLQTEQDTLPTTPLISKKVIPYQTRGGTCCTGVSTHKI